MNGAVPFGAVLRMARARSQLDDGLLVIPARARGVQIGGVDLLQGRDRAKVLVEFDPPIGPRRAPYLAVDGPPYIGDIL